MLEACFITNIACRQLTTDYIDMIEVEGSNVGRENTTSKGVKKKAKPRSSTLHQGWQVLSKWQTNIINQGNQYQFFNNYSMSKFQKPKNECGTWGFLIAFKDNNLTYRNVRSLHAR